MNVRFPQRRADGSFDMVIKIDGPPGLTSVILATWLTRWVERNATWERRWESAGRTDRETLRFSDEFSGPPTCAARDGGGAEIRCPVRSEATLWRDWGAKLYDDLRKDYEGVTLAGIQSRVD